MRDRAALIVGINPIPIEGLERLKAWITAGKSLCLTGDYFGDAGEP